MSISDKFSTFCKNLRMSPTTVNNIAYRYERITSQLNWSFWNCDSKIQHSLYVGSYGRGTAIHVSDIDIIFQLPWAVFSQYDNHTGNGQSALLQRVRLAIQNTYPSSYIGADGQVVKVDFSDGVSFEVVPCFAFDDDSFYYPDSNNGGSWKTTNPKPEIKEINSANALWNKNLKRLSRMARAWKDKWDVPMGGLLIDTLAYRFLQAWEHRDKSYVYYDWMTRDFFKFLKDQNQAQSYWCALGSGAYIWRTGNFEYKALRCYNIALDAISNEEKEYSYSANEKWREIYGTRFTG